METIRDFLGTFNAPEATPTAQPPAVPQTPAPAAAPEPSVPVSALPVILSASEELAKARALQAQAAALQPAPVQQAQVQEDDDDEEQAKNEIVGYLKDLKNEIAQERAARLAAEAEALRQQGLTFAFSRGLDPAFAVYVGGKDEQEVSASIENALRLQKEAEDRMRARLAPAAAPVQTAAPAAPPAPQVPVGTLTAAPPPMPTQVNAPSNVQAAAPAQQEEGLSDETFQYLTSTEAARNGDFKKYRHLLDAHIKKATGPDTKNWSINTSTPQSQQGFTQPPPPRMPAPHTQFAGISQPTFQRTAPIPGSVLPPGSGAPQPGDLERGIALDRQGALEAARKATEGYRARNPGRSHHG